MNHPTIPERIQRLPEIATDLWWTWNTQAREVFRRLDYPLWRQTAHNPVLMLHQVSQEMLNLAAADAKFLATYDSAVRALDAARAARDSGGRSGTRKRPDRTLLLRGIRAPPVAADLCRGHGAAGAEEASDLGIPLVGIGFMYPQGYFHQIISSEGWQQES